MNHATIQTLISSHMKQNDTLVQWWNRWMELYRGEFWGRLAVPVSGSDDEVAVDTNYTFGFMDTMVAGVVPAQPAASLTVHYPPLQESRRAREALINSTFKRNGLAAKLRRCAGLAGICGTSYIKAVWDPGANRVVYRPRDRRYVWVDPDAAEWEDVRYIIEAVPLTEAQFAARIKRQGGYKKDVAEKAVRDVYPKWGRADGEYDYQRDTISAAFNWIIVYEVYDFMEGKFYHVLADVTAPLSESPLPYNFLRNPFYPVTFNDSLANVLGISDVGLIYRLQMMLNELDTQQLQFAQSCIPIPLFNSSSVDDPGQVGDDLASASSSRDMVDVPLKSGYVMSGVLEYTKTPPLNPEHNVIRMNVMSAIENLMALPSWRRGEVGQAHIATEVSAAMSALQTRNGRRVAVIHDVMAWCARATMALNEEFLGANTVLYGMTAQNEAVEISRKSLGALVAQGASAWWDESYFAYKISSYDSPDDSLPVQLRALSQFLPTLIALPEVKRYALVNRLMELLSINPVEVLWPQEKLEQMSQEVSKQMMAQQMAGAQPPGMDGKAPDGRATPNGEAVVQPGVSPGGEVAAPGMAGSPGPTAMGPGVAGGPGIGL